MKTCKDCGLEKPPTEFYSRHLRCKTCQIARQRAERSAGPKREAFLAYQKAYQASTGREKRAERFDWMDAIKAALCLDCGRAFPPECMDFDHRDPSTKLFDVSAACVGGRSLEAVCAEIEKCDLICACCHRIRTARQHGRGKRRKR